MIDLEQTRRQLHADLGYQQLNKLWPKLEIVLGLLAVAVSLLLLLPGSFDSSARELALAAGIALFVLGGYLTLAGHRSHLYQSMNDRTAYLLWTVRRQSERIEAP